MRRRGPGNKKPGKETSSFQGQQVLTGKIVKVNSFMRRFDSQLMQSIPAEREEAQVECQEEEGC